jgi:transposase
LVIDRFHYIRQVFWAFDKVRKEEQKRFSKERRIYFKRSQKLLWARFKNLSEENKQAVEVMLNLPEFTYCFNTIFRWQESILNSFKVPYTNGYTEGVNNKIKVLKRNAFGVRNFERFRTRILYMMAG